MLNVGAGAGSYEPTDRHVIAVEPSAAMRAQRPPGSAPVVDAIAESLPLDDDSVDAAMATITVHQWHDLERGLCEMRRVARGPVVVLTGDPAALATWWLADYVPNLFRAEAERAPAIELICQILDGTTEVQPVPVPHDCVDGFIEAFYARPELLLDEQVRAGQSAWRFADQAPSPPGSRGWPRTCVRGNGTAATRACVPNRSCSARSGWSSPAPASRAATCGGAYGTCERAAGRQDRPAAARRSGTVPGTASRPR